MDLSFQERELGGDRFLFRELTINDKVRMDVKIGDHHYVKPVPAPVSDEIRDAFINRAMEDYRTHPTRFARKARK